MEANLAGETEYVWYLCLDGERIVGGLGVIENDFHARKDLTPNICAVYTEEAYRGLGVAGRLLNRAVEELRAMGVSPVYLLTDHTGFYERYGWEFFCPVQGDGEPEKWGKNAGFGLTFSSACDRINDGLSAEHYLPIEV